MKNICSIIQNSQEPYIQPADRKMARIIETLIDLNIDPTAFRLHSKGKGLICIEKNGFEKNRLVSKYVGEVYSPSRWYEKQDAIKKYMKD